jgi:hypothetical protein
MLISLRFIRTSQAGRSTEKEMIEEKIQRNVFEVADLHDPDDLDYWRDRSYVERIEAIEFMRKAMFGHDRVSERLQRVLTIAELKEN